ncbi:alpha/beta hydrolase [Micromonospora sp. NPDC023888]|uniref:alpha/beta hydrolase n=1 Tax=Micromonospora sp. NPDC023888 TaxID=3155607 RepID=UPI0033F689CD
MARGRTITTILAAAALMALPFAVRPDSSAAPLPTEVAVTQQQADPARFAAQHIVDVPVRFTVRNVNRSLAACNVDGKTYQVNGHLTAPEKVLSAPDAAITLYQHGIAAGEWYWRLDVPGYHHAEELAKRGHASLTVDRLGYGASSKPNGLSLCIGGEADVAHQIVQQLRAGTYQLLGTVPGARTTPRFAKVALAGQSNGGQIAQIATYSFRDIDALVIMDWTDLGLTPQANARFFSSLQTCMRGGSAGGDGGADGYAYYDLGREEFRTGNFHDTDPAVLVAALPHQNRHPCGDMASQLSSVFVDLRHLSEIKVPVLLMYGERDARVSGGQEHRALFTGTTDVRLLDVPNAGHYMGLERNAPLVHDTLASWLDAHRF